MVICNVGSKCNSEWQATGSVTTVQSKGMKMGLERRETLWNIEFWEESFLDVFGWRSCEREPFESYKAIL